MPSKHVNSRLTKLEKRTQAAEPLTIVIRWHDEDIDDVPAERTIVLTWGDEHETTQPATDED